MGRVMNKMAIRYNTFSLVVGILFALQLAGNQFGQIRAQATSNDSLQDIPANSTTTATSNNELPPQVPKTTPPPPTNATAEKMPSKKGKSSKLSPDQSNNCPSKCNCSTVDRKISCQSAGMKILPNLNKLTNYNWISLENNSIEELDFTKLPMENLEYLDMSNNLIKNFTFANNPKTITALNLTRLVTLNLRSNQLKTLDDFAKIKMPTLQYLDLSMNPIKSIEANTFNNTRNIEKLLLQQQQGTLGNLHEFAFAPLTKLTSLNMSGLRLLSQDLGQKQFATQQKLETLDLTNNSLLEVPRALRMTASIKTLVLNNNLVTSLRKSDFINRTQLVHLEIRSCPSLSSVDPMAFGDMYDLKRLILADNKQLGFISKDAFKSSSSPDVKNGDEENKLEQLELFDLSGNNLTGLENLLDFPSLSFKMVSLNNNPWSCNCNQKWLVTKEMLDFRSPLHCKSPPEYKDMEIGQYFATVDCELQESSRHTIVVVIFFLFLMGLTIAVVVQKNDLCRRMLFKDQYGSIYYTKASFPPETTA